jgi:peptidoglycan/xylan/chitin deacetylase (PgdA/CDA1 family)
LKGFAVRNTGDQEMSTSAIAFLLYHEIAVPGRELCETEPGYVRYVLDAPEFEAQMLAIRDAGFQGVSVTRALEFPSRAVAITFDDGCETDLLVAAPLLKQLGFGATFYVTSGRVGHSGYMSPRQLREICDLGFDIGCHSMTHAFLTDLDTSGLQHEIVEAKDRLEQLISKSVDHFSCPGGRYDSRVAEIARDAGYRSLATSVPRINSPSTDRFGLGRVPITRAIETETFQRFCRGEVMWTFALRARLRDRAKRVLGNAAYVRLRALLLRR